MKIIILIGIIITTLTNICYPQSGWFTQNSTTTSELRDVQFINPQTGWTVGFNGTIRKTTNGGTNWVQQTAGPSTEGYICCYFPNDMTGWIGGGHQTNNQSWIYKTTNGGDNWNMQYYSSNSGLIMKLWFSGYQNGWAAGAGGKILSTTDGGQTWIPQVSGVSADLTTIFFVNQESGWAAGAAGVILRTTTGGAIWSPYYSGTTQDLEGSHFISSLTGWVVGYNGVILKTTDGGLNWVSKPSGTTNWINSVCFVNYNTGWASGGNYYGSSGQILKTTNGGESWENQIIPSMSWLSDVHLLNTETGYATGRDGSLIKTLNGGLSVPASPILIFPLNNSFNIPINSTFRWSQVTTAQNYSIQISTLQNFAVITDSITVDTNLYNIPNGKLTNALTYFWRVKASNAFGTGSWSTVWTFSTLETSINPISSIIPKEFKVYNAYPNPFNPETKIKFDVPRTSSIKILIYDISGRQVDKLFDGNVYAGTFETVWDAGKYNSGVYVMRFISNEYSASKKLMLIK